MCVKLVVTIARDRGIPPDASAEGRAWIGEAGDYGESWVTVAELLAANLPDSPQRDALPMLVALGPPGDVRLLFNFDN